MLNRILALIVLCMGLPAIAEAISCDRTTVQNAINAAAPGATITLDAGTCDWPSPVSWSNKPLTIQGAGVGVTIIRATDNNVPSETASLLFIGTGSAGTYRVTGITFDGHTSGINSGAYVVIISGNNHSVRFDHNEVVGRGRQRGMNFFDDVRGVIDHNTYSNFGGAFYLLVGRHNRWDMQAANCTIVFTGCGDYSWSTPINRSADTGAMYVEDNIFQGLSGSVMYCTDFERGSRVVFRFNVFNNCVFGNHGLETGGRIRGARLSDFYRNTFNMSITATGGTGNSFPASSRSGTAMVFDNVLTSTATAEVWFGLFSVSTYRSFDNRSFWPWGRCGMLNVSFTRSGTKATGTVTSSAAGTSNGSCNSGTVALISGAGAPFDGQRAISNTNGCGGTSDSTFTFTVTNVGQTSSIGTMTSPFDGNTNATGYRCTDQAGAGEGALITGSGTTMVSNPTGPLVFSSAQILEPIYMWHNYRDTVAGATNTYALSAMAEAPSDIPAVMGNRDYFDQNDAACEAGGPCTSGIGRGSTLPTTCTTSVGGVDLADPGFWLTTGGGNWNQESAAEHATHTDQGHTEGEDGAFYTCTGTNSWTLKFTPLAHPHPLITDRLARDLAALVTGIGTLTILAPLLTMRASGVPYWGEQPGLLVITVGASMTE